MTASPAINRRDAIDQIKRTLPIRHVMRELGWRTSRDAKRADCGLCKCRSKKTVAIDEQRRLWHCHHCHAGGDAITLVRLVHKCGFIDALKSLGFSSGISAPGRITPQERRRFGREQARYQRIGKAAVKLGAAERGVRLWYRDLIHRCERKQRD